MSVNTISSNVNDSVEIDGSGDTWFVNEGVIINDPDNAVKFVSTATLNRVNINGTLDAAVGMLVDGAGNLVTIGTSGVIHANDIGVSIIGPDQDLINRGEISVVQDGLSGVMLNGNNAHVRNFGSITVAADKGIGIIGDSGITMIENNGQIAANTGIDLVDGTTRIVNGVDGVIKGTSLGISVFGPVFTTQTIVNMGTIESLATAIKTFAANDIVTNHGIIKGNVSLGEGNDVFDNRGGSWIGDLLALGGGNDIADLRNSTIAPLQDEAITVIYGGMGDDTYIIDENTDNLMEGANSGTDTVRSVGTHFLQNNFENLTLLGKKDADAYGTKEDNVLIGNSGDNVILGFGGEDTIDGAGGRDTVSFALDSDAVAASLAIGKVKGSDGLYSFLSNVENIVGSDFNDALNGDAKANVLEGGAGADHLLGDAGKDTVTYAGSKAGVMVDMLSGELALGDAEGDVLQLIENVTGSTFNDTLGGNDGKNVLDGLTGNDRLSGYGGADRFVFSGAFGKDRVLDFQHNDVLDFSHGERIFKNFGDLKDHVTNKGDDVIIHHGSDQVRLVDMEVSELRADDFLF